MRSIEYHSLVINFYLKRIFFLICKNENTCHWPIEKTFFCSNKGRLFKVAADFLGLSVDFSFYEKH